MKRLVVGVFVSALTVFGVAPAASAAPSSDSHQVVKKVKTKKVKATHVKIAGFIDWDAPTRSSSTGYSAQRIDWD